MRKKKRNHSNGRERKGPRRKRRGGGGRGQLPATSSASSWFRRPLHCKVREQSARTQRGRSQGGKCHGKKCCGGGLAAFRNETQRRRTYHLTGKQKTGRRWTH